MSKTITIMFLFSDGANHDASISDVSQAQELCGNYAWSLIPFFDNLSADPNWSLEVSNDNTIWSPYEERTNEASIDQAFSDDNSQFLFFRVVYNADGNTTGTVSFKLILK